MSVVLIDVRKSLIIRWESDSGCSESMLESSLRACAFWMNLRLFQARGGRVGALGSALINRCGRK